MIAAAAIILAAIAIAAAAMVIVGMRGRRIDDHPLCRRCGFDLTGKPAEATVCSECGSHLSHPKAITIGHRQRRGRLLAGGATLLLLSAVMLAAIAWAALSGVNLNPYKPLWMLRREAMGLSDVALTEINRRFAAGELSDAQIGATVQDALAFQQNHSLTWNAKWGDFIESARRANKVDDEQWKQYAMQAPDFQLVFRPRVRRGDRLAYRDREGPSRVGNGYPMLLARAANGTVNISGKIIRDDNVIGMRQLSPGMSGVEGGGYFDLTTILDQLKDGPQTVTIAAETQTFVDWSDKKPPLARRPITLTGTFTLLPADEPSIKVVNDESMRAAFEKAITIKSISIKDGHYYTQYSVGGPMAMAHRIEAIQPGSTEEPIVLGGCVFDPKRNVGGYGDYAIIKVIPPKVVDVYFKPNPDYAIGTTDIFEMWGGEIVIRNVPIQFPARTTQPASP